MNPMAYPGAAEEAESALPSPRYMAMALVLGAALIWLYPVNRTWFHFLAELLPLILGCAMFIVAQQTGRLARHAFVPCMAAAFFWASVLGIFQLAAAERLVNIPALPGQAPWLLELCSHTLLALGLLAAPGRRPGSFLEKWFPAGLGLVAALLVAMVGLDCFPTLFVESGLFSPLKIAWNWMLVVAYAAAGWLFYQQRSKAEFGLHHAMLAIIFLLVISELSFSTQENVFGLFDIVGHLSQLGAYWLMLAVVNHQLLLLPRRMLRRQTQLLQDVTSRVPGLAWQLQRGADGSYRFTFVSAGAADIFELTVEELLADAALGFARIVPRDREQLLSAMERSSASLTPWKLEWQAVLPRQGRRWHRGESSIPVIEADGGCRWVGHVQDITEEKLVGLELARHRDHLAALVRERTEELQQSMLQTEQAARARTEFLSNMSHEIRTPLNAVLGVSQIALRDHRSAPARHWLRQIHESGHLLLMLVNDILDMAKIDAGRLELEARPVRLSAVIQRAMRLTSHRAHQQQLEFGVQCAPDLPAAILADETRLTQVLVNLLGNAIKFTERGSVHMTVSRLPAGQWLLFAIEDTGIGMSPQQLQQLYKPFVQADASTTRRFGGTGLGLSIAKRIVDLMRGSIDVSSQSGRGSCFTLRIPFTEAEPPAQERAEPLPGMRRLQGLRILVAEDDAVNQWVLRDLLEQEGAACRMAGDGLAALALLESGEPFDLLLTDVQMPGLDGYDTARRSRALRAQLPIIGVTAYALPQERQRCLDAGMDEHVTKPVDVDALCAAIAQVLARRGVALPPMPAPMPVPQPAAGAVPAAPGGDVPVLDWAALWRRLRRPAAVQRLMQTLLAEHGATPARLREVLAAADVDEASRLAHRLAGVSATVFAAPTHAAARRLEQDIQSRGVLQPQPVQSLADALQSLLDAARAGLDDLDATRTWNREVS
ncbi:ATP-binding protein [Azohydromonas lata]|uniref:histidine kinase n=1 Tax=Azohydromonas lata TaxID=45677 RepID=A0ABU5IL89_9BURK|nr:ATP-binding protein [Azohydromonas lata]MDZ5459653.1 ATP-binding protein [Azohydromonas lata]